jgi:2-dehydro-3-deoxygluconokinase
MQGSPNNERYDKEANVKILTFGEIMLRLRPPGNERLFQSNLMEATFGGGEANVAVSLANYGLDAEFITVLPKNKLGDECIRELRRFNVKPNKIIRKDGRLGIYFLEQGTNQLPSKVIYDREYSALSLAEPGVIDWDIALHNVDWLHITGITPALSPGVMALSFECLKKAKDKGLTVSLDLNYRKNLWKYGKEAHEVMCQLIQYADILIANEEDIQKSLGIQIDIDPTKGNLDYDKYKKLSEEVLRTYPNIRLVAITLRDSISANSNGWAACLNDRNHFFISAYYEINDIVDRIGGGDAFAAGLIYGLHRYTDHQRSLEFAVAASCLKHSVVGDFNRVNKEDVINLMDGNQSGRVER